MPHGRSSRGGPLTPASVWPTGRPGLRFHIQPRGNAMRGSDEGRKRLLSWGLVLVCLAFNVSCAMTSAAQGGTGGTAAEPAKSHEVQSVSQQALNAALDDEKNW